MNITACDVATRFSGIKEVPGMKSNPVILAMLQLDGAWPTDDSATPWCSGFVNFVAWLLDIPRSKSLSARSWLKVGRGVPLDKARCGFHVVVLKRGAGPQPGPDVLTAPGHVAFFVRYVGDQVEVLGGNQSDSVSIARYPTDRVLGIRDIEPVA